MIFYVARHGQTEWNAENKICGITDIDLTEKGIVQADELAEQVKEKDIEIKKQYDGKNVLIISHGGVCRIIKTYFCDMTNEEFFHYTLPNCKLEEYHI